MNGSQPIPRRDADTRSPRRKPAEGRVAGRRRRRTITSAGLLTIVGLLLANTVMVARQDADATGNSTLPLDGGNIHVSQDGPRDAPALVLIHGLAGSTHWWGPLVPMLARTRRVIRIDLLGHGRSAKPAGGGYKIPEQGHRVGAALDHLGIKHATVIGHSTGGSVATALAEHRPDLVTALALINTGPSLDAFISDGLAGRLIFTPVAGHLLWRFRTDGLIRRAASTAFSRPGYQVPQQVVDDGRSMTYHAITATDRAVNDYLQQRTIPQRLKTVGRPLLVIFGKEDKRWRSSSADQYHAVPGAKVELLPGIGHSPMLEDPQRTAALLLAFTATHTAPAN